MIAEIAQMDAKQIAKLSDLPPRRVADELRQQHRDMLEAMKADI